MDLTDIVDHKLGEMILHDQINSCLCDQCQQDICQLAIAKLSPHARVDQPHLRDSFHHDGDHEQLTDAIVIQAIVSADEHIQRSPRH